MQYSTLHKEQYKATLILLNSCEFRQIHCVMILCLDKDCARDSQLKLINSLFNIQPCANPASAIGHEQFQPALLPTCLPVSYTP